MRRRPRIFSHPRLVLSDTVNSIEPALWTPIGNYGCPMRFGLRGVVSRRHSAAYGDTGRGLLPVTP